MKKLIIAAVAAAIALPAGTAVAKDHRNHGYKNHGQYVAAQAHARNEYRKWAKGQRFDRRYAPDYRVLRYSDYNRLYAPPSGYQWVRSGNDALLVGLTSGIIQAVVGGLF